MKSVLISIQPKWVEKIASGKKTIEVRKTRPKLETPFKCYIYQTKSKDNSIYKQYKVNDTRSGKVIGEFVCDRIEEVYQCNSGWVQENACLSQNAFFDYLGIPRNTHFGYDKKAYGWHISDLKIYDKPKELSEFYSAKWDIPCENKKRGFNMDFCMAYENGSHFCKELNCDKKRLTRPPQSWCYVESLGE
jgi:predicted transcriptional regulator